MKFIVPTILLVLSIASFVVFTNPAYQQVKVLKAQAAQYDTALANSRKLQEERDTLNAKYRNFTPDELDRLTKLLPDNTDNIRLIIDIQQMAQSYGMTLATIKFDAGQDAATAGTSPLTSASAADVSSASQDYGAFDLTFSTTATYENFINFIKDVESSLRLTDIESVDFSAGDPVKGTTIFTVQLRTYWLKS